MKNEKLKIIGLVLGVLVFLATATIVLASPGNKFGKAVTPPFPQPAEKDLQKVVFIRYAPGREPTCNNNDICDPGENWKKCPEECEKPGNGEEPTPTPEPTACYGFLSGAKPKWNWVEDYYWNNISLDTPSTTAVSTWEASTSGDIFRSGAFGNYPWGEYDLTNSISYGKYPESGVIAVTAIWFRAKTIYEYDIMFDEDYFPGDGSVDLDTVVLHEFGHGAGLDDLYDVTCQGEVMYGYYTGIKTALGNGDITGIQTLYGK